MSHVTQTSRWLHRDWMASLTRQTTTSGYQLCHLMAPSFRRAKTVKALQSEPQHNPSHHAPTPSPVLAAEIQPRLGGGGQICCLRQGRSPGKVPISHLCKWPHRADPALSSKIILLWRSNLGSFTVAFPDPQNNSAKEYVIFSIRDNWKHPLGVSTEEWFKNRP